MLVRNVPIEGGTVSHSLVSGLVTSQDSTGLEGLLGTTSADATLPCQEAEDADLWFADAPEDLERAKAQCVGCPIKAECLAGALRRGEPWGVWGGEIFQRGSVIARKRPKGRPSKAALARDRALAEAGAPL